MAVVERAPQIVMMKQPVEAMRRSAGLVALAVGALGVVYGDIGTSPLYAFRQCLAVEPTGINTPAVLGILSLVFWSLTVVICIKYLTVMMHADNHGEGGILALLSVVCPRRAPGGAYPQHGLILLGLFGASLLYGDGVITPAISVLSAIEGLEVATTTLRPYIVPITIAVLVALFAVQRYGTARVGAVFGPIMLIWFVTLGVMGLYHIVVEPPRDAFVLEAINPIHAVTYLSHGGFARFLVLGAVVLAITGAEALYADMGHFGPRPIRLAWYTVVYPCLLLNYFGQGALVLARGNAVTHSFFQLAPDWGLYPLVGLSTVATVVASQALISGAFSLTNQAMELGYAPRMKVVHTSKDTTGQIYMPQVNLALMVLCVILVLGFRSSSALANAYGIAVTGTMSITTILFYFMARQCWHWSPPAAGTLAAVFLLFDLSFLAANLVKIEEGGWVPIGLAVVIFTIMTTWRRGRMEVHKLLAQKSVPLDHFLAEMERRQIRRVPGTGVFFTLDDSGIPPMLVRYARHTNAVHERVILLWALAESRPRVAESERVTVSDLGHGFYRLVALWGFKERPSIEQIVRDAATHGLTLDPAAASFFVTRESLQMAAELPMRRWRRKLFGIVSRRAILPAMVLGIPPERIIEVE